MSLHTMAVLTTLEGRVAENAWRSGIEVRVDGNDVLIRDAKNPDGPWLRVSVEEWQIFLDGVRAGEFDPQ